MTSPAEQWKQTNHLSVLPDWGPYSKRFFGISHLADSVHGHRFDFFAVPSFYRRAPVLPDVLRSCGYLPWDASPHLEFYSCRYQLEWKDRVYADVSYSQIDSRRRLFCCEFCNRTDLGLDFTLHLLSMLATNPQERTGVKFQGNGFWLDAVDYSEIHFNEPKFFKGLNPDALRPGEIRSEECVGGSCLGQGVGAVPGDTVQYTLPYSLRDEKIFLRYRLNVESILSVNGSRIRLCGHGEWQTECLGVFTGETLNIVSETGNPLQLDGFGIGAEPIFQDLSETVLPEVMEGPVSESVILHFPCVGTWYGIRWEIPASIRRQYAVKDISKTFLYESGVNDPTSPAYHSPTGSDAIYDIVLQPLFVPSHSTKKYYAVLACGSSREEVATYLHDSPLAPGKASCRRYQRKAQKHCMEWLETPYTFSQKRMQAVTLTNIVYPIYLNRNYIRHYTPGRCWDSLYTWDSGFIGLGLLEIAPDLAAENLKTYTFPPENRENAFVRHGTPLPTQIILFHELMNKNTVPELRHFFYPRVKKIYDFLSGKHPDSQTLSFSRGGLLSTWKYSYNSGGWDDYPAQKYVHQNKAHHILPVIPTAMAIRTAKLLSYWAETLGLEEDVLIFQRDVRNFTEALQNFSWNKDSGYFSYILHDMEGRVKDHFLMEDGTDWNMGLDGISPLIAGAVLPEQESSLWDRLMSPEHFRTQTGISTVDMRAPYFRTDGYANGANWTAFEYFLWKSALDCARFNDAWKIASVGLRLWQTETEAFYACFEHFSIRSGRGTGWHHFSSFSTPYSIWFHAYFTRGRLTTGFDTQVLSHNISHSGGRAELKIHGREKQFSGIILNLIPETYRFFWQGHPIHPRQRHPGTFEITLPCMSQGVLEVVKTTG